MSAFRGLVWKCGEGICIYLFVLRNIFQSYDHFEIGCFECRFYYCLLFKIYVQSTNFLHKYVSSSELFCLPQETIGNTYNTFSLYNKKVICEFEFIFILFYTTLLRIEQKTFPSRNLDNS